MAEFQRRWGRIKKKGEKIGGKGGKKFKCDRNETYITRARQSKAIKCCPGAFHYVKLRYPLSGENAKFSGKFSLPLTNIDPVYSDHRRIGNVRTHSPRRNLSYLCTRRNGRAVRLFRTTVFEREEYLGQLFPAKFYFHPAEERGLHSHSRSNDETFPGAAK